LGPLRCMEFCAFSGPYASHFGKYISSQFSFMYYNTYTQDKKALKLLVLWVWTMDTVHQGMMLAYEYNLLILRFGDLGPIIKPYIDINVTVQSIFTILVSVPIQMFFVHRIYRLSDNKVILPIFLIACVTLETITGLLYTGWLLSAHSVTALLSQAVRSIGTTYVVVVAFVDLAIAVTMVFLLQSARVTGMSQTQKIITHLIIYSVNTGLWTALLAISTAVTMIFYSTSFVYVALGLPLSSLYANTLLANLNVRQHVRGMHPDIVELSLGGIPNTNNNGTTLNFMHRDGSTAGGTRTTELTRSAVIDIDGSQVTRSEIGSKGTALDAKLHTNV